MKALADYIHSRGLRIGIYSSPGPLNCAHFAGSYGHEAHDAKLFASWGIDYLKYDLCGLRLIMRQQAPDASVVQMRIMIAAYNKMDRALNAYGRPIVYSLCEYGWDAVLEWAPSVGANLWRTTRGVQPVWESIYSIINSRRASRAPPDPAMGTIPLCSNWVTVSSTWRRTAPISPCGPAGRAPAGRQ